MSPTPVLSTPSPFISLAASVARPGVSSPSSAVAFSAPSVEALLRCPRCLLPRPLASRRRASTRLCRLAMSPLRRIASSRHRRHVLLPINRRPLLLSTAVAIDLAAIAALPSPSTATPFSTVPLPPAPPASAAPFSSESPHVDLLRATSDPVPISSASPSGNLLLGWW
ncbi:hypothetical protein DAI22_03g263401 [Oryza sativa Japonica Group]|nr:hypothetical protein DAI22_03g263401 [Oryza sativa Japonica Group]